MLYIQNLNQMLKVMKRDFHLIAAATCTIIFVYYMEYGNEISHKKEEARDQPRINKFNNISSWSDANRKSSFQNVAINQLIKDRLNAAVKDTEEVEDKTKNTETQILGPLGKSEQKQVHRKIKGPIGKIFKPKQADKLQPIKKEGFNKDNSLMLGNAQKDKINKVPKQNQVAPVGDTYPQSYSQMNKSAKVFRKHKVLPQNMNSQIQYKNKEVDTEFLKNRNNQQKQKNNIVSDNLMIKQTDTIASNNHNNTITLSDQKKNLIPLHFSQKKHIWVHNFNKNIPFLDSINCRKITSYQPPTTYCIYAAFNDVGVSKTLISNEVWEPKVHSQILEYLARDTSMGFIDIGANIGAHSIHMAKLGRKVVAVEPVYENIKRFHKAAVLNKVTLRITLIKNGIYDKYTKLMFQQPRGKENNKGNYYASAVTNGDVNSILLDDLSEILPFKSAVMKINLEGLEPKAFLHAQKLLTSVHIDVIFMDWSNKIEVYQDKASEGFKLTTKMLSFLSVSGYVPMKIDTGGVAHDNLLDLTDWGKWPTYVKFVLRQHL